MRARAEGERKRVQKEREYLYERETDERGEEGIRERDRRGRERVFLRVSTFTSVGQCLGVFMSECMCVCV